MKKNIKIEHIDNPIVHLGIEFTATFIKKSEEATENLNFLINNNLIDFKYVKLSKLFYWLKKFRLKFIISFLFQNYREKLLKNSYSAKPSLFLFDLYRIGYFCNLNSE